MERDDSVTDAHGAWPRLTREQIEELSGHGRRRRVAPGEVLFDVGDRVEDLIAILDGRVAIEDDADDAPIAIVGPRCFLGEIGQLTGQASFVRAAASTRCATWSPATPPSVT
jgi:thioredoxin reductase (NADPH)